VAALRTHAKGLYYAEAAVELLIAHRRWLERDEFVGRFVWVGRGLVGGRILAVVDWAAASAALGRGRLTCSDSEGQVLAIAASIGAGVPVDLREALTGLDAINIELVAAAVARAGGHRGGVDALVPAAAR
jgi:hypothetical protein